WHLPIAHELETWGDARAFDGTASIAQPLIAPLYGGKSAIELMSMLLTGDFVDGRALVRQQWAAQLQDDNAWNAALQVGVIANTGEANAPELNQSSVTASPPPHPPSASHWRPLPKGERAKAKRLLQIPSPRLRGEGSQAQRAWQVRGGRNKAAPTAKHSSYCSVPIPRSALANGPTTAGCRNCPNR